MIKIHQLPILNHYGPLDFQNILNNNICELAFAHELLPIKTCNSPLITRTRVFKTDTERYGPEYE